MKLDPVEICDHDKYSRPGGSDANAVRLRSMTEIKDRLMGCCEPRHIAGQSIIRAN